MNKILIHILLLSALFARDPLVYFYLLPFDNVQNDASVEWIGPGLSEIVKDKLKNESTLRIQNNDDLEYIMNNRSELLKQPRGSKNLLLLGKFNRKLDDISVSMQLIDIATWEEVGNKSVSGFYSAIPALKDQVGVTVHSMLTDFLPKQVAKPKSPFPDFAVKPQKQLPPKVSIESERVASSLDAAILELEASMDFVLGAKKREEDAKKKKAVQQSVGEWSMDFTAEQKVDVNPENDQNSALLETVLDQLISNPYQVKLERPNFIYHEDDEQLITVQFKVEYSLKENIIHEMLTTLPYTGLQEDGSLTVFYYSRDKFNFPQYLIDDIISESYRKIPVIQFFDKSRNPSVVLTDTPDSYWHARSSSKVLYIPSHKFSPLINFTMGGWSMQIAMETVTIPITYEFTLPVNAVENLSNVTIKFVNEADLRSFLDPIL